jgi:catechol 2,3-dioxygenase-like lactoylglutathione lyase family enzyme/ketosteroid isomerase-like protein
MDVAHIDHVAIAVTDVERSVEWYSDVLGMDRRHPEWGTEPAMVCAGETCVALFAIEGEAQPPPARDAIAMRHLAFRVDRAGFERAQSELRERGIAFEVMDHQTAHSVYFQDPDGHRLELTTYEVESRESVYRRALDAFNRGDREAFVACWHEQCEYWPGLESVLEGSGAVVRSPDGIRSWWDSAHEQFSELSTQVEEVHDLGDRLLGVILFQARGSASGAATEARVAQLTTFRDGKILLARDYFDVDEGKRAAGR